MPRLVASEKFDPVLDRVTLIAYAEAYATWREATDGLAALAKLAPGDTAALLIKRRSGNTALNPLFYAQRAAAADMVKFADLLGLTPGSRARLDIQPPLDDDDLDDYLSTRGNHGAYQ